MTTVDENPYSIINARFHTFRLYYTILLICISTSIMDHNYQKNNANIEKLVTSGNFIGRHHNEAFTMASNCFQVGLETV